MHNKLDIWFYEQVRNLLLQNIDTQAPRKRFRDWRLDVM